MEIREYATSIVCGKTLAEKLTRRPEGLTDLDPGPPQPNLRPARPAELQIIPAIEAPPVPRLPGISNPQQRHRILHAFANHEFQAVELFAWALLAFPDAPSKFRQGVLGILADEQKHFRMYEKRLLDLGVRFGDQPVTGYFWNKIDTVRSPLGFVCAMSLTFENANLDHTENYSREARKGGDESTAVLLEKIQIDEIEHVRFGYKWLMEFKDPDSTPWDTYTQNVTWPIRPALARGSIFHEKGRKLAGLHPDFIALLERSEKHPTANDARSS